MSRGSVLRSQSLGAAGLGIVLWVLLFRDLEEAVVWMIVHRSREESPIQLKELYSGIGETEFSPS